MSSVGGARAPGAHPQQRSTSVSAAPRIVHGGGVLGRGRPPTRNAPAAPASAMMHGRTPATAATAATTRQRAGSVGAPLTLHRSTAARAAAAAALSRHPDDAPLFQPDAPLPDGTVIVTPGAARTAASASAVAHTPAAATAARASASAGAGVGAGRTPAGAPAAPSGVGAATGAGARAVLAAGVAQRAGLGAARGMLPAPARAPAPTRAGLPAPSAVARATTAAGSAVGVHAARAGGGDTLDELMAMPFDDAYQRLQPRARTQLRMAARAADATAQNDTIDEHDLAMAIETTMGNAARLMAAMRGAPHAGRARVAVLPHGMRRPVARTGDTGLTYEQLLSLDDQIIPRGVSRHVLANLPRRTAAAGDTESNCAICLENMRAGDALIALPCEHEFHERCIATWLARSKTCPHCRLELE